MLTRPLPVFYTADTLMRLLTDPSIRMNINQPAADGYTPLTAAAVQPVQVAMELVPLLIRKGASIDMPDSYGWTALNIAVAYHTSVLLLDVILRQKSLPSDNDILYAREKGFYQIEQALLSAYKNMMGQNWVHPRERLTMSGPIMGTESSTSLAGSDVESEPVRPTQPQHGRLFGSDKRKRQEIDPPPGDVNVNKPSK